MRLLALILGLINAFVAQATGVQVENLQSGSSLDHQVVILRGTVETGATSLDVTNTSQPAGAGNTHAVLHEGRFKAIVELVPGMNRLELKSNVTARPQTFELTFQESKNPYSLRVIWMTDSTGNTDFATPVDNYPQDYESRMRTAALLMQAFTADRMAEAGLGRRTFRLERGTDGKVVVHTRRAPETAAHYATLKDTEWWAKVRLWLNQAMPDPKAKNMVVAAFTRKDPATGKLTNHTALGGDNLGLFGSGSVFAWPRSIEEAGRLFADATRVDPARVHDDSAGRGVIWALVSTTVGATLHEMGHTFGLPHTKEPHDIMTRGFDRFSRAFTFYDPPSRLNLRPVVFPKTDEAQWEPVSATALRWSRWFAGNEPQHPSQERPQIFLDEQGGTVTLKSGAGLRWAGFISKGDVVAFEQFPQSPLPTELTLKLDDIRAKMKGQPVTRIDVIGANGERVGRDVK